MSDSVIVFFKKKKDIYLLRVLNLRAVGYSVHVQRITYRLRNIWLPIDWLLRRLQCLSYNVSRPWGNGGMHKDCLFDLHQFMQKNPQGWSQEIGVVIRLPDVRLAYCQVLNI